MSRRILPRLPSLISCSLHVRTVLASGLAFLLALAICSNAFLARPDGDAQPTHPPFSLFSELSRVRLALGGVERALLYGCTSLARALAGTPPLFPCCLFDALSFDCPLPLILRSLSPSHRNHSLCLSCPPFFFLTFPERAMFPWPPRASTLPFAAFVIKGKRLLPSRDVFALASLFPACLFRTFLPYL